MLGNLNQRASILARTVVADGGGGIGESWNAIASAWVSVTPISGDDVFGPDAAESRVRHKLTLRRNTDVTAGMRVAIASRTFHIRAVLDEGPQASLTILLCEELP
jgi:SPP1 family predicted phage head-tail adaptor